MHELLKRVASRSGVAALPAGLGTTALFISAILAGSALGHLAPEAGSRLGSLTDPTVLLLVWLLIFEVQFSALGKGRTNIRFLLIAWLSNFVLVPLIGFTIASLFLSGMPLFFTGLVIYFMAPCTDWFLGFTRLARGNTALGAVLLPINLVTQLLLYPVYLHLFAAGAMPVDPFVIADALAQWFLMPVVLGAVARFIAERALTPAAFRRLLAWTSIAIPAVIACLILEIFAANIGVIVDHASVLAVMLAAIFLFFVTTFLSSEVISKMAGFAYPEHALLTMTVAARNAPMMLTVTSVAFPDQPLILAAIVIGMLVEFPHLTALKHLLLAQGRRQEQPT